MIIVRTICMFHIVCSANPGEPLLFANLTMVVDFHNYNDLRSVELSLHTPQTHPGQGLVLEIVSGRIPHVHLGLGARAVWICANHGNLSPFCKCQ